MKQLGGGSFGQVFLVKKKSDGKLYAMKALKKKQLIMKNQLKYAIAEAEILKKADHPFILCLHYAFQTPYYLYIVLDYCPGGDLSYHLAEQIKFSETISRFYIAELVLAIERLHEMDVIYRDLKPENILIDIIKASDGHIKLADFGLAKQDVGKETARSFCGSPAYLSPEMLKNQGVGKSSDIYGIGTVLYEMLTGNPPYYADDIPTLYKNIAEGNLTFPDDISFNARDLLEKLLNQNPEQRIGISDKNQLRKHSFFEGIDWEKIAKKNYEPPHLQFENDEHNNSFIETAEFYDIDYNQNNSTINRIHGFSYSKERKGIEKESLFQKESLILEFS